MSISQSLLVLIVQFLFQFLVGLIHTSLTVNFLFHVEYVQFKVRFALYVTLVQLVFFE